MRSAGAMVNLSRRLVLWALAIELSVSANVLTMAGVPYVTEGGCFMLKIHPGTYLLCAAFVLDCAGRVRATRLVWAVLGKERLLTIYLGSIATCLLFVLCTSGKGNLIVLIDTFLPAGMIAMVLQDAEDSQLRSLRILLQWGIAFNAFLALFETIIHARLIPLYLNATEYHSGPEEFRPTGLYDHPLTGGAMTMIGLALAPNNILVRFPYTMLLVLGMLAFGGRAAVMATIMSFISVEAIEIGFLVSRRDSRANERIILSALIGAVGVTVVVIAASSGLGTRLAGHLYWDPSAQVRLAQWHLLENLHNSQLLFGTSRDDLRAVLNVLWLDFGVEVIENFWLLMFVSLGAFGFCIFLVGLLSLLAWCWSRTSLRGKVLLAAVIFVVSASNSLGRKSTLLVGLVAATSCFSGRRVAATVDAPLPKRPDLLWSS